jgi:hypothetical protein
MKGRRFREEEEHTDIIQNKCFKIRKGNKLKYCNYVLL